MNRKATNVRAENANDINKLLAFFKECKKNNKQFYWDIRTLQWQPPSVVFSLTYTG
ncbi:hypothetical protein E2562_035234, partial [Oryza meyeriana var. granulata]